MEAYKTQQEEIEEQRRQAEELNETKLEKAQVELLHHNQLANALQSDSESTKVLQQQVMQLTHQIQQLKEQHRLELAQLQGNMEIKHNQTPLQPSNRRKHIKFDPSDPNMESEFENLELDNMNLRAQVDQLKRQLVQTRLREKELQQKLDSNKGGNSHWGHISPPSPGYHMDGTPAEPLLNEATQLEAGFEKKKITLALEPECAALYYGYLIQDVRATLQEEMLQILSPGARYLLLDIGGGAVDITAHEVNEEFQYDELFAVTGGPWGRENVNLAFQDYLRQIFTNDTFSEFCRNHMEDFYELMDDFERKKKTFDYTRMRDVVIKLPYFLLKQIDSSSVAPDLAVIDHDKLKIPYYRMLKFFDDTIDKISQHIKDKLQEGALENITSVILVGGFSVSGIVKERLKNLFPNDIYMYFHCPENAELATLTGAVIYGQIQLRKKCILQEATDPYLPAIHSRRSRYTYGIDSHVAFNPEKHPESKKFRDGMEAFCKDFFWVFLRAGTKLTQSKKGIMRTFTVDRDSKTLDVVIYRTEKADPKFVDDPACFQLGKLTVDMSEGVGEKNREIKIGLQYNDTELSVYAINNRDEVIKTTFDMLDAV